MIRNHENSFICHTCYWKKFWLCLSINDCGGCSFVLGKYMLLASLENIFQTEIYARVLFIISG